MEDIQKIYFKSDFDFVFNVGSLSGRLDGELADFDFEGKVFSDLRRSKTFSFSRIANVCINCVSCESADPDSASSGLEVRVTCDRHNLPPGPLSLELAIYFPDPDYPDGCRKQVCIHSLPIELVAGECDCKGISPASVRVTLPYIWESAYDLAVVNGYSGSKEQYYAALADMPDSVGKLNDALSGARSSMDDWSAAEQQRATAEQGRDTAERQRTEAESARAEAEAARVAAESERAEKSLYGSFSIDFGTASISASDFNLSGEDVSVVQLSFVNVAKLTVADGENVTVVIPSDAFVPFTVKAGANTLWSIERTAEGEQAAVGVRYKVSC